MTPYTARGCGGHTAIDLDDGAWSAWVEAGGNPTGARAGRGWAWREDRVLELLTADGAGTLFVSGCAPNMGGRLWRFDHVVLLRAPLDVMLARLAIRTDDPYGKRPEVVARVLRAVGEPIQQGSGGWAADRGRDHPALQLVTVRALDAPSRPSSRRCARGLPARLLPMAPLIVIMLDGISADAFARFAARMPHLHALAARGLVVERVAPDVPATSLPGRTGILTGLDPSHHGIYGNLVRDGAGFRHANPDDVRVTTLPQLALAAGLDVAVLGYGMVRPEDATTFHHAWWAHEMLQRARDEAPLPADESWLRTSRYADTSGRIAALAAAGLPESVPDAYAGDRMHYVMSELTGDQTMMQWTAALAAAADPPDLIVTEVLTPDTVQHMAGHDHPFALWSFSYADALVGEVVRALDAAGRLEATGVLVLSDHGHGPVDGALYLDALLPGATCASEGGTAHVAVDGPREAERIAARLSAHGVERLPGDHLPRDQRDQVAAFTVPGRAVGFETTAPAAHAGATSGPSRYRSSHGFAPGTASDERFLIVAGGGIDARRLPRAAASDVAATASTLLGLPLLGAGRALC